MATYVVSGGGRLSSYNKAFTLAEVLITLAIIGVVAAMTMPSLIQKYQEQKRVTQLKKAYAVMQNAYLMAVKDYGELQDWGLTITNTGEVDDEGEPVLDNTGVVNVMNILMKYVQKVKMSEGEYIGYVQSLDGRQAYWPWKVSADKYFLLPDGTMVSSGWINNADCSEVYDGKRIRCGDFWIVFPKKSTMKIGVDVFNFSLTKEGFKPNKSMSLCNKYSTAGSADQNGRGCSGWVLINGNMDYLHREIKNDEWK